MIISIFPRLLYLFASFYVNFSFYIDAAYLKSIYIAIKINVNYVEKLSFIEEKVNYRVIELQAIK